MKNKIHVLDGNSAAAEVIKLARVKVIAAYPITPISPTIEILSEMVDSGAMNARFIRVESEHTAISYIIGAQLTGVRATTATSSVGLALMHEVIGVASGCRLPIVMPIANRALVSPWSLWCDHQDSMAERDSGWIQFYAENVQEVVDLMIMAYNIAENSSVLLPVMVCFDGFLVSHSKQLVFLPEQKEVDAFLQEYKPKNLHLNTEKPLFINNLTSPEDFSEMRYQQEIAFENALRIIPQVQKKYFDQFERKYGLFEEYRTEDAKIIIICLGSMAGTVKYVVDKKRKEGLKVACIKITSFRPFPYLELTEKLNNIQTIGVIDRSAGLGAQLGSLALEIKSLININNQKFVNYIAGLGGRDITENTIENIFNDLKTSNIEPSKKWIDTSPNACKIRRIEVEK